MAEKHSTEVSRGERFRFGSNWEAFLKTLDEDRIREAERSLEDLLGTGDLSGSRFLDAGSGSGLFSLAARRLGAEVRSFDFDPRSVWCTREVKRRYRPDDEGWVIEEGSILDEAFVASLGRYDIVYSWGVLHHTGDLGKAMRNAMVPVSDGGLLVMAIYNHQEYASRLWKTVKRTYCSGRPGRAVVIGIFVPLFALQSVAVGLVKHGNPLGHWSSYRKRRGMSLYHDWMDWLGGYPFETARPEEVFELLKSHGYRLEKLITTNRHGCNQFVFRKERPVS